MESQDTIFDKLKQSKVFKVLSGYAIAAFVTVQVASLVSDSFGLEEEFMQNIIIVFLVILPFIALVAWAASSKYGTFKILGISLFLLFTGYGTGSYIWVNTYIGVRPIEGYWLYKAYFFYRATPYIGVPLCRGLLNYVVSLYRRSLIRGYTCTGNSLYRGISI